MRNEEDVESTVPFKKGKDQTYLSGGLSPKRAKTSALIVLLLLFCNQNINTRLLSREKKKFN